MKRLFLVEDDLSLISGLSFAVKKQGYEIDAAHTTLEAHRLWVKEKYDLVILDVSLPDGSGFDLCQKIRQTSNVPILFLTAAAEETDTIMGLDIGGDDYITSVKKHFLFRVEQEGKNICLSGNEEILLLCDRTWIIEAISNLVKNALDHTEKDNLIRIEWRAFVSVVQITVTDNGSGIYPEDIYHIFKRFYRSRFSKDTQGIHSYYTAF